MDLAQRVARVEGLDVLAAIGAVRERIWPVIAAGTIRPVIGRRLPMREAGRAHQLLLGGAVIGKVVLTLP